ncbi:SLAP domain-containing protein [Lactobacillus sp. ESL0263]|uniref:SLAP domain-containing protein n=1 Tax=Lactobacillus sp. ESL0263 TaxID=2069350 RepID=UPI001F426C8E|nr:SLAP domain-containing protein [Lactobacillus sp. ESL0263]
MLKINKKIATALCAVALTGVGAVIIENSDTQTVLANHQGTKVWLQYGTLKYALKGPSGRVYPAGTKVVRELSYDSKPKPSYPAKPFYLTLEIGGIPGNQLLQDVGGGEIAEAYVNYGDWNEIDYPSDNVVLVNNTTDYTDLKSSDFHPVDSDNPDVPVADTSKLDATFLDYTSLDFSHYSKADIGYGTDLQNRYFAAKAMGVTQASVDSLTQEINDAIARYKATGHIASADNSSSTKNGANNGNTTITKNPASISKSRKVRLRKASYRYTSKGKRVSKKLLKKGSIVTINGKTYHIKGKAYYRIGKNRYIRVANVVKN